MVQIIIPCININQTSTEIWWFKVVNTLYSTETMGKKPGLDLGTVKIIVIRLNETVDSSLITKIS